MTDTRPSLESMQMFTAMYFMANCYNFTGSHKVLALPYEVDLLNELTRIANIPTPFLSRDRQKKLAMKDIALYALTRISASLKAGAYSDARQHVTYGINSIHQYVYGQPIFDLLEKAYSACCDSIRNSPDGLDAEETRMMQVATAEFRKRAVNAGLMRNG